jgi:N6-L-threonylcarbamoyladenine synthase
LRDNLKEDEKFIENNLNDLCASLQSTVVDILMSKLKKAVKDYGIKEVAVAGGVSANSALRTAFEDYSQRYKWNIYIPKFSYTTDNAAMVAIVGYFKYLDNDFCDISLPPFSKVTI